MYSDIRFCKKIAGANIQFFSERKIYFGDFASERKIYFSSFASQRKILPKDSCFKPMRFSSVIMLMLKMSHSFSHRILDEYNVSVCPSSVHLQYPGSTITSFKISLSKEEMKLLLTAVVHKKSCSLTIHILLKKVSAGVQSHSYSLRLRQAPFMFFMGG